MMTYRLLAISIVALLLSACGGEAIQRTSAIEPLVSRQSATSREPIAVAATPLVPAAPAQAPVLPVAARVVDAPAVTMTVAPATAAPSRRVCGQCQAELSAGAKFCAQCGAMFGVG